MKHNSQRQDYAVGNSYGNIDVINRGTDLEYIKGTFTFYHGVVTIYSEPKHSSFSFVHNGRHYHLTMHHEKQQLTHRQLIIRAGKFGRQIITENKRK